MEWTDISADESAARSVMMYAKEIAPCLPTLIGEDANNALAILQRAAKALAARGIAYQQVGEWKVGYSHSDTDSAFSPEDRAALRSLCGLVGAGAGHAVGSFPPPLPAWRP